MIENIFKEINTQKSNISNLINQLNKTIDINEEISINNSIKIQCDILSTLLNTKFLKFNVDLNKAQQQLNKQMADYKEQKLDDSILVYFLKEGKTSVALLCKKNEYIKNIIQRYRNISGDNDKKIEFILNQKSLNDSLTIKQSDITQFSNIYVISSENIKNHDIALPAEKYFYYKNQLEHFYDIIIDIDSLYNLNKGFKVKFSDLGKQNYDIMKTKDVLIVGVLGNKGKGKTFLLSKLSGESLPIGIKTKGICIKYPEMKDKVLAKYIIMDSAGSDNALLENDKFKNFNSLKDDDKIKNFRLMNSDESLTNNFIQNFVIKKSNIKIVVLGELTSQEQKLLMNIKNKNQKISYNSPILFVVHNLKNFSLKKQVEDYIEEVLLKSATFKLEKRVYVDRDHDYREYENRIYFLEIFENDYETVNYHLILAMDGTEAGNFYNPFTFEFISGRFESFPIHKKFPIIEDIKYALIENSMKIMKNPIGSLEEFENSEHEIKLKSKDENKRIYEKYIIDEFGEFYKNNIPLKYSYYKTLNDNKQYLCIQIEMPGECTMSIKASCFDHQNWNFIIDGNKIIKTNKNENNEDIIFNTRDEGDFKFNIEIPYDICQLANLKPDKNKTTKNNGVTSFFFLLVGSEYESSEEY